MKTLVLATSNRHKIVELEAMLAASPFTVRRQREFFSDEVEEDGLSFIENALKKARFASEKTGLPALADDSGLEVDYLNGQPGIYSARYTQAHPGHNVTDEMNMQQVLEDLQGLSFRDRKANYYCAMVYVRDALDPTPLIGVGRWQGDILLEPRTKHGIGYDPIMWIPSELRAASEVSLERKNQVSHRAQALRAVLAQLTP